MGEMRRLNSRGRIRRSSHSQKLEDELSQVPQEERSDTFYIIVKESTSRGFSILAETPVWPKHQHCFSKELNDDGGAFRKPTLLGELTPTRRGNVVVITTITMSSSASPLVSGIEEEVSDATMQRIHESPADIRLLQLLVDPLAHAAHSHELLLLLSSSSATAARPPCFSSPISATTMSSLRAASPLELLNDMKIPRTWPTPWSLPAYLYDPEMASSMEPLKACQIRSIEAVRCVSSFELGLIPMPPAFVIDKHVQDEVSQSFNWQHPLTVPTKALKYNALEWIVSYEDYRGMLMALSVRKLIKAPSDNGEDPVKELDAVDTVGFRKCVVVDLQGIGVNRKVGLFFVQDSLRDLMSGKLFAKVLATTIFDNDLWDMFGVHAVECDIIVDFRGTMEIIVNCHYSLLEIGPNDTTHQAGPSSTQAVGTANVDLVEHYLGPRSSAFVRVSVHLQNLQKDQTFMADVKTALAKFELLNLLHRSVAYQMQ
ncbi:hypothetical protein SELMODRAFT_418905 [Selaginella moellendorffii]|uniref:Uncharacterized protein n=1 Tax=Selaginella moellendorffii TaxID=88036 RepID=D8S769_SELML|nr:hypothetical protein SELMODRAFT_418905 [Selaginella moellendorffii]